MAEAWEHLNIEANGIDFHCVAQGEGDLVLLLHGFPENWYSWRHQIPFLAEGFKVVAPDMRGYNLTDKPPSVEDYRISNLVQDVASLIEAFGSRSANVVGHDWGGAVAWVFAASHPEMLNRLAVLNCPHPALFARNIASNPRQLLRSWYMFFFQIPALPEAVMRSFDYFPIRRVFRDWAIDKDAFSDQEIERLAEGVAQPGSLRSSMNYYRAMLRDRGFLRMRKDFPTIEKPTMLIWAEEDRALGKELTYGMDPYFSDTFEIKYIPDCSHWVQQERPLLVNQYLGEFLNR